VVLLLFVPANFPALRHHYHWEKENWRGIGEFISENIQPDEAIVVSPYYWSQTLLYYQPSLLSHLEVGSELRQFQLAAQQYPGVWFLRHSRSIGDPTGTLTAWATDQGFEKLVNSRTCGWGIHVYYGRFDDQAATREADLLKEAAVLCPNDPRFRKGADQPTGD
jgi:hypothetical protein